MRNRIIASVLAIIAIEMGCNPSNLEVKIPRESCVVRVSRPDDSIPAVRYGVAICTELANWANTSEPMTKKIPFEPNNAVELSFLNVNEELATLVVYCQMDAANRANYVALKWGGGFRIADGEFFDRMVTEPETIDSLGTENSHVYYRDINFDGLVDAKYQMLDSREDIVWVDSDLDGIFDTEFFLDKSDKSKRLTAKIHISVPRLRTGDGHENEDRTP